MARQLGAGSEVVKQQVGGTAGPATAAGHCTGANIQESGYSLSVSLPCYLIYRHIDEYIDMESAKVGVQHGIKGGGGGLRKINHFEM